MSFNENKYDIPYQEVLDKINDFSYIVNDENLSVRTIPIYNRFNIVFFHQSSERSEFISFTEEQIDAIKEFIDRLSDSCLKWVISPANFIKNTKKNGENNEFSTIFSVISHLDSKGPKFFDDLH